MKRLHVPTHPGAMSPAQAIRRTLYTIAAASAAAAITAALIAIVILFS